MYANNSHIDGPVPALGSTANRQGRTTRSGSNLQPRPRRNGDSGAGSPERCSPHGTWCDRTVGWLWATVLFVNVAEAVVEGDGSEAGLTPTEWHLLETLVRFAGKPVGHRQLLREV